MMMLMLSKVSNWDCRHLDYELVFTQASTDTDAHMKIPTGFHAQDTDGQDASELHYLIFLKNCYGTRDAAANWHAKMFNGLIERVFARNCVDPCMFAKD